MSNPINSDVFDSRDLIEYKTELEQEILDTYMEWAENHNENIEDDEDELDIPLTFDEVDIDEEDFTSTCSDLIEEYEGIRDFVEELEGYGDFDHGETLIHEDYFEEYCKQLCQDCGYIPSDLPAFIENNIDWDAVSSDLMVDYTSANYNGSTYYMRA